jgi:hypothetical protein
MGPRTVVRRNSSHAIYPKDPSFLCDGAEGRNCVRSVQCLNVLPRFWPNCRAAELPIARASS